MPDLELDAVSRNLKVLAEPRRLEIIALLKQGVQCNCELGGKLNMAPNLISHHLRVLQEAGLITTERAVTDARWIYYSLNTEKLTQVSAEIRSFLGVSTVPMGQPYCGPAQKRAAAEFIPEQAPEQGNSL